MNSLFDSDGNAEIISRIGQLNTNSQPGWGKMNVSQMLAHCQVPFMISYDELHMKRGLAGLLFGKMAKKKMLSDQPIQRHLPTFKEAKITGSKDFDKEKGLLINYISRMASNGPEGLTKKPHPFFGPLTTAEWDQLQYKHLDHHLRQFGV